MQLNLGTSTRHLCLFGVALLLVSACSPDIGFREGYGEKTPTYNPPNPYVDDGCHIDCFGGFGCVDGAVFEYYYGAGPCSGSCYGAQVWTCSTPLCAEPDPRYIGCLDRFSELWLPDTEPEHLFKLYCEEGQPKLEGDPCLTDADCRPAAEDPAPRLLCDATTDRCVRTARPVIEGLGGSCGLTRAPFGRGLSDQLAVGELCELCLLFEGPNDTCVSQACTVRCEFDEDCPEGFVCACWEGVSTADVHEPYDVEQVCVRASSEDRWRWHGSGLSCSTVSCCGAAEAACESNIECCSGLCDQGSRCVDCSANQAYCVNDFNCCSGFCDPSGACATRPCEKNADCDSLFCDAITHVCSPCMGGPCSCSSSCCAEGMACSQDVACCTGQCSPAGICTVPQCD